MMLGLIAADTSRTRAYLEAIYKSGIRVDWCLKLKSPIKALGQIDSKKQLPEVNQYDYTCWPEARFDPTADLDQLLKRSCKTIILSDSHDINSDEVITAIEESPCKVIIYSGYGGSLLRAGILSTGKSFLHVHGGYLPDFKGSTTNYYSLIARHKIGASSIFLTPEIDGGPILLSEEFDPPVGLELMDHIFDNAARSRVLVKTLKKLKATGGPNSFSSDKNCGGDTYYIIHPLLKHLAILRH